MVVIRAAITSLLVLASACTVGEVPSGSGATPDAGSTPTADAATDGGSGSTQTPDETFAANVSPVITACFGCHNSANPAPDLHSATTLLAKYKVKPGTASLLVTKGTHSGPNSTLNDTQKTAIVAWLNSL